MLDRSRKNSLYAGVLEKCFDKKTTFGESRQTNCFKNMMNPLLLRELTTSVPKAFVGDLLRSVDWSYGQAHVATHKDPLLGAAEADYLEPHYRRCILERRLQDTLGEGVDLNAVIYHGTDFRDPYKAGFVKVGFPSSGNARWAYRIDGYDLLAAYPVEQATPEDEDLIITWKRKSGEAAS